MDLNDHHAREVCIISQELLQCQCNNVQGVGRWSPPSEVVDLTKIKGQFGGKLKGKLQEDRKAACGGNVYRKRWGCSPGSQHETKIMRLAKMHRLIGN